MKNRPTMQPIILSKTDAAKTAEARSRSLKTGTASEMLKEASSEPQVVKEKRGPEYR